MTLDYTARESRIMRAALEKEIYKLETEIDSIEMQIIIAEIDGENTNEMVCKRNRLNEDRYHALCIYKKFQLFS